MSFLMKEYVKYKTLAKKCILVIWSYHFKSPNIAPVSFIKFKVPMHIYNEIKNSKVSMENIEEDKEKILKSKLSKIATGNPKNRNKDRKSIINFYNSIKKVVNDYAIIISEARYKTKYGEGFKILALKKMLQRLSTALAQVKAGNNSKTLLNKSRKIVYTLYQSKKRIL